jgi:hypothetical protein
MRLEGRMMRGKRQGEERGRGTDIFTLRISTAQGNGGVRTDGFFGDRVRSVTWSHASADAACEGEGFGATGVAEAEEGHGICVLYQSHVQFCGHHFFHP